MRKRAGIKELRQYRGMTQEDLAGMIGVSQQTLQKWETGKRTPKKDTLDRIYNALGVCDIITIGNPNDTPASEVVGDNVSVDADVQEDEEVYSVTEKDLNAHAYNVMVRTLHTCATKDEMMIVGYALDEFINEITGGNEDD
ncbi:XRE family transcriptional regulator [Coprococcus eutactus]|uniref:XRE family transcriptional regulator n=1 Tax=Coprococcus eutactus TaxID=33043 RepID=A0A3R5WRN7_9FIRM|nr:XRE family transcriptional regulator [Coprococcus eutactus]